MASSCRRPEHSAPPDVVSRTVYCFFQLLFSAGASSTGAF